MDIPLLDLKAQYNSIREEINQKVLEVISSQHFILGPEVEGLEREIADYSGIKFAVGVSSGSDALIIALMALGVGQGDAVVTTPFTFFATGGAISRLGANPVFCDIDEKTYNIDPEKLDELLKTKIEDQGNKAIKAILPVHLYGQCADMAQISVLAKKYALFVVEDAAQSVGAEYQIQREVKKACALGDLGMLSFFPSKNLGGYGDGGMVLTDNESLAEKLKILRVHGSRNKYFYDILGGNFRLDALQAAVLRVKLKHLDEWLQKRKERAARYDKLFIETGLVESDRVQIPDAVYKESGIENYHTYHQYVIRAETRGDLQKFLKEKGIPTAIYYPLPLHLQKCFADLGYGEGDFPVAEKAATEVLSLPIYPELKTEQQYFIVSSIKEFYS